AASPRPARSRLVSRPPPRRRGAARGPLAAAGAARASTPRPMPSRRPRAPRPSRLRPGGFAPAARLSAEGRAGARPRRPAVATPVERQGTSHSFTSCAGLRRGGFHARRRPSGRSPGITMGLHHGQSGPSGSEERTMAERVGRCTRDTRETQITAEWVLDGAGRADVQSGIGYLDHMLDSLARHGLFDLHLRASGDLHVDEHHTVEDVAIALGSALGEAVGDRRGLRRMGDATVPLDEALALVAVDLSGRGLATLDMPL